MSENGPNPIEAVVGGVRLRVQVQPRASRSEVVGVHGDWLRVRLAAPPVGGAANDALVRLLAKAFGVPVRNLTVTSGHSSRRKTVVANGVEADAAARALGLSAR